MVAKQEGRKDDGFLQYCKTFIPAEWHAKVWEQDSLYFNPCMLYNSSRTVAIKTEGDMMLVVIEILKSLVQNKSLS